MSRINVFHYVKAICLVLCGFFLIFTFNQFWGPVFSLKVLETVVPLNVFGLFVTLGGLLIFPRKTRIVGYIIGIICFGAISITGIISIFTLAAPHTPLVFALPVIAIAYMEGLYQTIRTAYYD